MTFNARCPTVGATAVPWVHACTLRHAATAFRHDGELTMGLEAVVQLCGILSGMLRRCCAAAVHQCLQAAGHYHGIAASGEQAHAV